MTDPDDKNTPAERVTNNNNVTSIVEPRLEERAIELGLVRERRPVFVFDATEAKKRGGSAERMAKLRDKQAAAGLRPAAVPAALLAQVKEAGGWEAWEAKKTAAPAPEPVIVQVPGPERVVIEKVEVPGPERVVIQQVEVPGPERVVVEKVEVLGPERVVVQKVEVPVQLGNRDMYSLMLGRQVEKLTGWRRAMARFVLKLQLKTEY